MWNRKYVVHTILCNKKDGIAHCENVKIRATQNWKVTLWKHRFTNFECILIKLIKMAFFGYSDLRIYYHTLFTCEFLNTNHLHCTLFGCGLMLVLVRIYPRYSVSIAQNFNFGALTLKPTSHNLVKTNLKWSRWSSRIALVRNNKS